jgi:hypothetical protein
MERYRQLADSINAPAALPRGLVKPEILEPCGRELGMANRVRDVPVTELSLNSPSIMPLADQGEATGVSEHVGMHFDLEFGPSTFNHPSKAFRRERSSPL